MLDPVLNLTNFDVMKSHQTTNMTFIEDPLSLLEKQKKRPNPAKKSLFEIIIICCETLQQLWCMNLSAILFVPSSILFENMTEGTY